MTDTFSLHIPFAYERPQRANEFLENVTVLLAVIRAQYELINHSALDDSAEQHAADLGVHLCGELAQRIQLLYDHCTTQMEHPADHARPAPQRDMPTAAAPPRDEVLQAGGFELLDSGGRIRAVLGFDNERHPGLWLYDRTGGELVSCCLQQGDPYFFFSDGNIRLELGLFEEGPSCRLSDDSGRTRLALTVDGDGTPSVTTYDAAGKKLWSTPAARSEEE